MKKLKGFSGTTHILIAILFLFLMLLIPTPFTEGYLNKITNDYAYFLIVFTVIAGASLLPDLDNDVSTAGYRLGIFGKLVTIMMKITSSVMFNFTRMKNDKEPKTQHRMLWHSVFISIMIMLYMWFGVPDSDDNFLSLFLENYNNGSEELVNWLVDNSSLFVAVLVSIISVQLGFNGLTWRIFKIVPNQFVKRFGPIFAQLIMIYCVISMSMTDLKYITLSVGIGYLFHNLGDLFSLGSIPIIWPIPAFWLGKWWWKPHLPFQINTGGLGNKILDIVLLICDLILFYILFIKH